MLKRKAFFLTVLLFVSFTIGCKQIYYHSIHSSNQIFNQQKKILKTENHNYFAYLEIPKLNMKKELFEKDDIRNQVDQNVTILKESIMPDQEHSILFLAAHSGTGEHAYFNTINQLQLNDDIIIYYDGYQYHYQVMEQYEEKKNGKIHIKKAPDQNQIVLTTCSTTNNNKQFVITGILSHKERET